MNDQCRQSSRRAMEPPCRREKAPPSPLLTRARTRKKEGRESVEQDSGLPDHSGRFDEADPGTGHEADDVDDRACRKALGFDSGLVRHTGICSRESPHLGDMAPPTKPEPHQPHRIGGHAP